MDLCPAPDGATAHASLLVLKRAVLLAVVVGAFLVAAPSSAAFHTTTRPNQPYVTAEQAQELERWFKLKHVSEQGFPATWAKKPWWRVMRQVGTMPAVRVLGGVNLTATGVYITWKVARASTDGSWDPLWALITGTELGTVNTNLVLRASWDFHENSAGRYCNYGGPCLQGPLWELGITTMSGAGWFNWCDPACGSARPRELATYMREFTGPGRNVQIPGPYCGSWSYTCWIRYATEGELEAAFPVKALEAWTGQAHNKSTSHTVPAMADPLLDAGRDQVNHESVAVENEVNWRLDPSGWQRPWADGTGGGPILAWPVPQPFETYADYLNRLRVLGWVGTARLIQLDEANGDPAYGPGGVPCTSVIQGTPTPPALPVAFYVNPASFSGGSSSSGWNCGSGVPAPPGDCEYDHAYVPYPTWQEGLDWVDRLAYERACQDAWNYFVANGGTSGQPGSPIGGRIKNPDVVAALTADQSDIDDWEKVEWGPYSIHGLTFVVHAYRNKHTTEVKTISGLDYKVKFRTEIPIG